MITKTLPERIADQLRRDILRGTLEPGQPIKERDRAAAMEVSRTPMREAVRILAKEGLVILRPSRSPIVANPTFEEITHSIEVLMALEEFSAELACSRALDEEVAEIREMHGRMMDLADRVDSLDLFDIDMAFHKSIVRAAHNPALADCHKAYLDRMWRIRYLSASQRDRRDRTFRQHEGMVIGLETRDTDMVRTNVRDHLSSLLENIRHKYETPDADSPAISGTRSLRMS
jgi:DNA-binding GntR family transcriptional regulator